MQISADTKIRRWDFAVFAHEDHRDVPMGTHEAPGGITGHVPGLY